MNDPGKGFTLRAQLMWASAEDELHYLEDGIVVVDQAGMIEAVMCAQDFNGTVDQHMKNTVVVPGFVDAHLHYPQTRVIGSASGPLLEWLDASVFPEEARFDDSIYAESVARLFLKRMARAGTTLSLAYGSVHSRATDVLFSQAANSGQRLMAGPVLMDVNCPEELILEPSRAMAGLRDLIDTWNGFEGRIDVAVVPRFALCCSPEMMQSAGEVADEHNIVVTTHLSENLAECGLATEMFGADDYLQIYERYGLVRRGAVFAHCIHNSDSELDRIAEAGAVIAHCPDSNAFLGSGGMPLGRVRSRGISIAIGTDVAAGRSFSVPHNLSAAYDNGLACSHPISLTTLLWWGTEGGARALGKSQLGRLESGYAADMVAFEIPAWAESPKGVLGTLLFERERSLAKATWVRGRQIEICGIEERFDG